MDARRVLVLHALAALLIVGCQSTATLPVAPAAVVDLGDEAAAAKGERDEVVVLLATAEGVQEIASGPGSPGEVRVNLMSMSGTGDEWNTFVYGSAVPGAVSVEISPSGGAGGQVVDGAWLVALRDEDVQIADLHWRMLDAAGAELVSGDGILSHEISAP